MTKCFKCYEVQEIVESHHRLRPDTAHEVVLWMYSKTNQNLILRLKETERFYLWNDFQIRYIKSCIEFEAIETSILMKLNQINIYWLWLIKLLFNLEWRLSIYFFLFIIITHLTNSSSWNIITSWSANFLELCCTIFHLI